MRLSDPFRQPCAGSARRRRVTLDVRSITGTCMRTMIVSGVVSGAVIPRRRSGGFSFSLGEPPTTFYSPGALGAMSIQAGDFIAVAAKRTFVPGAQYVALAYRRLGVNGPGQTIGAGWPVACMAVGLLGGYAVNLGAMQETNGPIIFIPMILLGIFGALRLLAMRHSVRLLNRMEMPLTTHVSTHPT